MQSALETLAFATNLVGSAVDSVVEAEVAEATQTLWIQPAEAGLVTWRSRLQHRPRWHRMHSSGWQPSLKPKIRALVKAASIVEQALAAALRPANPSLQLKHDLQGWKTLHWPRGPQVASVTATPM